MTSVRGPWSRRGKEGPGEHGAFRLQWLPLAFWTLLLGGPAHLGLIGDKRHLPDTVKGQGDSCQRRQRLSGGWGWSSRAAPRSPANAQHRGRRRPGLSVRALSGLHRFTVWPGCPPRQALLRRSLRPLHAVRLINTCAPARGLLRHDAQKPVSRTKTDPASEARPGTHRSRRLLVETQREAGRPPSSHDPRSRIPISGPQPWVLRHAAWARSSQEKNGQE